MKKLLLILLGCSLALATGAHAEDNPKAPKEQGKQRPAQHAAAQPKQAMQKRNMGNGPRQSRMQAPQRQARSMPKAQNINEGANRRQQAQEARARQTEARQAAIANRGARRNRAANSPAIPNVSNADAAQANQANRANRANIANQANRRQNRQARKLNAQANQINVQAIRAQRANFRAQARPQQVPAVSFNQNHRIRNASNWRGERYSAFRSYRPARHDRSWYSSRYNNISLFGGGYYYWNSGYWYPAWGYDTSNQYYAYDGPIYVGSNAQPVDRVIAEVQDALQQQGYYHGEVDGLLGPLTRQALTDYQADNGIYTTATIDQPTLDSLGLI